MAHRDCDAIEPTHERIADALEQGLLEQKGITHAVAAAAAWEIETWRSLWPDAALALNSKGRRPDPPRRNVGKIENAKEAFRQALRPRKKGRRPRDYAERDSPKLTAQVKDRGIIDQQAATSRSFDRFVSKARALVLT